MLPSSSVWHKQIAYIRERLYILEGTGLAEEMRVKIISDVFTYMAEPENIGLLRTNAVFRQVVVIKIAQFRSDPRAAAISDVLDRLEAALAQ
jgi:hypothetical protein